jgi:hypothetical protein
MTISQLRKQQRNANTERKNRQAILNHTSTTPVAAAFKNAVKS